LGVVRTRLRISDSGRISIPAPIRRRWGTSSLILEDHGDRIVLKPDDPIAAAEGALAADFGEIDLARLRRIAREGAVPNPEQIATVELPSHG
jgi:AbrB family looped-hinge helix DNA binding protein